MTNRRRSGGSLAHNVGLTLSAPASAAMPPSCRFRLGPWWVGNPSRLVSNSASNQACKTTFGQLVTPLDSHLAGRWVEQREHLGSAMPDVFMRVTSRLPDGLPTDTWLGDGLVRAGFIHPPHR